jgi:hypothetical protein
MVIPRNMRVIRSIDPDRDLILSTSDHRNYRNDLIARLLDCSSSILPSYYDTIIRFIILPIYHYIITHSTYST